MFRIWFHKEAKKYMGKSQYDVKSRVQVYQDEAFAKRIKMGM
jgi:hypothetical protein